MPCDPASLADAAKCLACLTPDELDAIYTQLLCQRANAVANPMLAGIYAYWKIDEPTGVRADSVNSFHLTDNGVTSVPGKISNGALIVPPAGAFTAQNAPNFEFAFNNIPFTVALWVKLADKAPPFGNYALIGSAALFTSGWYLQYIQASDHYGFTIMPGGTLVPAYVPAVGAWDLLIAWNDGVTSKMQINNGAVDSANVISPPQNANGMKVGSAGNNSIIFNGSIDEVGIWTRVLTDAERALLWNGGAGKSYPFT